MDYRTAYKHSSSTPSVPSPSVARQSSIPRRSRSSVARSSDDHRADSAWDDVGGLAPQQPSMTKKISTLSSAPGTCSPLMARRAPSSLTVNASAGRSAPLT